MRGNPIFEGTLLDKAPAWEFIEVREHKGWHVRIHGEYVADAETGEPTIFHPPRAISTMKEFVEWSEQVKASIAKMSGRAVVFGNQTPGA